MASNDAHDSAQPVYGLTYPNTLLAALPQVRPPTPRHPPVYALSATEFKELHTRYLTRHAPDSVLFPWLHGLEVGGEALRSFFAASPLPRSSGVEGACSLGGASASLNLSLDASLPGGAGEEEWLPSNPAEVNGVKGKNGQVSVPRYRGLMWISADDRSSFLFSSASGMKIREEEWDEDEDEDDLEDVYTSEEEGMGEEDMDVDAVVDEAGDMDVDAREGGQEQHMHPVNHRAPGLPPSASTSMGTRPSVVGHSASYTTYGAHDRRFSTDSGSSSFASSPSTESTMSVSSYPSSPGTTPPVSPTLPATSGTAKRPAPTPLPIEEEGVYFTSTFFERELVRKSGGDRGGWEFLPAKVPEGISLRNFGVQVPIYATISDIVVYSPTGNVGRAVEVAERVREAMVRKEAERAERLGGTDELVKYNVFVLQSSPAEMGQELEYLLMRREGDEAHSASSRSSLETTHSGGSNAHTDGHDAHVVGEMDLDLPDDSTQHRGMEKARGKMLKPNTIDFAQREKDEMRDLTRASEIYSAFPSHSIHSDEEEGRDGKEEKTDKEKANASSTKTYWNPLVGQIFLGNSGDVPLAPDLPPVPVSNANDGSANGSHHREWADEEAGGDPFDFSSNDPAMGYGYDVAVECHDLAPFPTTAHMRAAEEHLCALELLWAERCGVGSGGLEKGESVPPRPPPNANSVIHLPFPSSPSSTAVSVTAIVPFVAFLERLLRPVEPRNGEGSGHGNGTAVQTTPSSVPCSPMRTGPPSNGHSRSFSTGSYLNSTGGPQNPRSRPIKVLIYSSDGYTESSVLALCLLMALKSLTLPEAYLELQVEKRRSFFVYQTDLGLLKRVETRLMRDLGTTHGGGAAGRKIMRGEGGGAALARASSFANLMPTGRPAANTVSYAPGSPGAMKMLQIANGSGNGSALGGSGADAGPSANANVDGGGGHPRSASISSSLPWGSVNGVAEQMFKRPRSSTSPAMPSFVVGHEAWFDDPRFDGSFPSRVLPFLYLGNLNHALNAYMLHALGITHVVSVGECALVPPTNVSSGPSSAGPQFIPGKGPGGQGSLWIEEREGRIKVLDIQGVCDDGIDTLEPQLEPICDWIEKARAEGGQVLVHCRVGVSRSATVTIAYVMKYLGLPLVDAYLIVRSRRLSVLIQPNMRLLYNLLGWEVKLAKQRAGDDVEKLRNELSRSLNWPYFAREVHALNEKYLH